MKDHLLQTNTLNEFNAKIEVSKFARVIARCCLSGIYIQCNSYLVHAKLYLLEKKEAPISVAIRGV